MSTLKVGLAAIAASAALLLIPGAAAAATGTPVKTIKQVAVSGTSQGGKKFVGRFNIQQFVTRGAKSYAVGTLVGRVGNRHVSRSNVAIPVGVQRSSLPGTGTAGAAAACPVLHLVLGPLHLNLLGLHVNLNQVVLDITAQSGPGNLLGNLVCGIANLLNGGTTGAGQLTGLLNILQQLLNVPALTSL
ncbi:MAG TPA: hypothetical protein VGI87_02745 [Solirubrobacteraceae bacterium]|jgi:hypothetical protein